MSHVSKDTGIIHPTLHHINLKTTRLQEMIEWYGTVVGMKPNYYFPGGAWLTNDEANRKFTSVPMVASLNPLALWTCMCR
ncbi:MAG: hypothetical protein M3Z08_14015 [Chloroflexota bacterium]|nr:hypothetical protein [Chloroflexota bacterium]